MAGQLEWSEAEILAGDAVDEPLVVGGVVCHGGFVGEAYVSPRSRFRMTAVRGWQERHEELFGVPVRDAPLAAFPGHYPNLEQARFLLRHGLRLPLIGILTRIGTVEGYGGAIRELAPRGDVQRHFADEVASTATAHLGRGLLEAHARDESGYGEQAGHDRMWYAVRDIAFEDPLGPAEEQRLRELIERAASGVAAGAPPRPAEGPDIDPDLRALITFMARVLFVEIRAFHAFAWAEALLGDAELAAGDGAAARLVSYIRQDETPHVEYLRTALSEMRERTFLAARGRRCAGAEVIDPIWDACLADAQGTGDRRNRAVLDALLEEALRTRGDAPELRAEFDRLGTAA